MEHLPPLEGSNTGGVWPPPPTNAIDDGRSRMLSLLSQYRSPVALSRWMLGFMGATVISDVSVTPLLMSGPSGKDSADTLSSLSNLPHFVAGILFLIWTYRLYKNLIVLGVSGLKFSPTIAVLMCVLPVLNLYQPVVIFGEIWRASALRETIARAGGRWKAVPSAPIIVCWWIAYLLYSVVAAILGKQEIKKATDLTPYALLGVTSLVSGTLLTIVALRLNKREEARYIEIAASLKD
ncbi:hypothetical protein CCAX7_006310 [Capsulimonas corticalis]|uniref:DUF4328 domain-containing protein n=1 Tax=Capsulimonas corticalis TaxID=2219043 RepID=A0A402D3G4_9BACT|nr:DUF4328 domain-containing protein [Capsulimonas corticalis]BDI28580.1 hypothetical protein CCAX7_006310 [Capsulimonas corticalis]